MSFIIYLLQDGVLLKAYVHSNVLKNYSSLCFNYMENRRIYLSWIPVLRMIVYKTFCVYQFPNLKTLPEFLDKNSFLNKTFTEHSHFYWFSIRILATVVFIYVNQIALLINEFLCQNVDTKIN